MMHGQKNINLFLDKINRAFPRHSIRNSLYSFLTYRRWNKLKRVSVPFTKAFVYSAYRFPVRRLWRNARRRIC